VRGRRVEAIQHGAGLGGLAVVEQGSAECQAVVGRVGIELHRPPEIREAVVRPVELEVGAAEQVVRDRIPRVGRVAVDVLRDLGRCGGEVAAVVGGDPGLPVGVSGDTDRDQGGGDQLDDDGVLHDLPPATLSERLHRVYGREHAAVGEQEER
jgi:hypothetical protein